MGGPYAYFDNSLVFVEILGKSWNFREDPRNIKENSRMFSENNLQIQEECRKIEKPYWESMNTELLFWEGEDCHSENTDGFILYSDRTSVGQAYRRVSRECGFDELDAGKTMGLSAYGS